MQPVAHLLQLNLRFVLHVEYYGMNTICISDEMVVNHVVSFYAGKFPHTQVSSIAQVALEKKRKTFQFFLSTYTS